MRRMGIRCGKGFARVAVVEPKGEQWQIINETEDTELAPPGHYDDWGEKLQWFEKEFARIVHTYKPDSIAYKKHENLRWRYSEVEHYSHIEGIMLKALFDKGFKGLRGLVYPRRGGRKKAHAFVDAAVVQKTKHWDAAMKDAVYAAITD